ncbi:hypothetical protein ACFLXI_06195 [Chloroflexota bacterium]
MSKQSTSFSPRLGDDDKLTPVMIYTSHSMVWGQAFSKQAIRVSTWLYTEMAPTYMKIYNAQQLMVGGSNSPVPVKRPVLHLQTRGINAFHLMSPFSEGADYDPDEPNRKLVTVSAYVGYFRFDGFARMAEMTTMDNYLGAAKGEYISIYDIKMTCPLIPSIKGIKAPMVLLRQSCITFTGDEA